MAGREEQWTLVTGYRVGLAREKRNWAEAERLQKADVNSGRQRAASLLARPRESLDETESSNTSARWQSAWKLLATCSVNLASEDLRCASYEEALELSESIDDRAEASICAFNLGNVPTRNSPLSATSIRLIIGYDVAWKCTDEIGSVRTRPGVSGSWGP